MSQSHKVAVVVGSLRKESWNRKIALALQKLAPASLQLSVVEIGDLPFYNEDLDASPPAAWSRFRDEIRESDAVLFITPEYNRSVPAALKNALDVGSRPYGHSVWSGKPGAVISASPGQIGGFGANHHLRQSLVFLNVLMLQQPEAYLGSINKSFDDARQLASDHTREFLSKFITAFDAWVQRLGAGGASSSGA